MEIGFKDSLIGFTKDGVLDKSEISELKKLAASAKQKNPFSQDTVLAAGVMTDIEKIKNKTSLTYSFTFSGKENTKLKFDVVPTYAEKDKVEGALMDKALEKICQGDAMEETTTDSVRCGTSSVVDIALRTLAHKNPGKSPEQIFAEFAKKIDVPTDFTYENVHKAQNKLHLFATSDKLEGLNAGFQYSYVASTGKITNLETTGDVKKLTDLLGLKTTTLLGPTKSTIHEKKDSVNAFLKANPDSSIMIGVYQDDDGNLSPVDQNGKQNHFVEVYHKDGGLYIHNTGLLNNNDPDVQDKKLEQNDIEKFLYTNPGTTLGIY